MKNYDEMSENVLKRRDEELKFQKLKRKNRRQIALSCAASVAALGIVVGAVDYTRYTRDGAGFIFQAFKNRGESGNSSAGHINNSMSELAPAENYTIRKDVPDYIKFVELKSRFIDEPGITDGGEFYPVTLEELNRQYDISFEALGAIYPDWSVTRSDYGDRIDYGNDDTAYYKKIISTLKSITYKDGDGNDPYSKYFTVEAQQTAFSSPDPDDHIELVPPNPKPSDPAAGWNPGWTDEQLEFMRKQNQYPSIIAGWPAKLYYLKPDTVEHNIYFAIVQLDHCYVYAEAGLGVTQEEFLFGLRAVLKAQQVKVEEVKQEKSDNIVFKTIYEAAGNEKIDEIYSSLSRDQFQPMTLEEINAKYGINFEALNGKFSIEPFRYDYGIFTDGNKTLWSENLITYHENNKQVTIMVQENQFYSPDKQTPEFDKPNSVIDGYQAIFYCYDKSSEHHSKLVADVFLENGYLRVFTNECSQEELIEAVKAVLKGGKQDVSAGMLAWPVGGDGGQISEVPDFDGGYIDHKGLDIAAPSGTEVYAGQSGVVADVVQSSYGYGNHVVIKYDNGLTVTYAHLSLIDSSIYEGKRVETNEVIGYVGSTGDSTADILHFEVRDADGKYLDPLDHLDVWSHSWKEGLLGSPKINAKRSEVLGED